MGVWYGNANGQLKNPSWVAVSPTTGNVYVVDNGNSRVQEFSSSGVYVTQWGSNGNGNDQFNNPNGITVDAAGNVYVADYGNNRIEKFTSTGTYTAQWGSSGSGNGQFSGPVDLAVSPSGNLYVTDKGNYRIQEFTPAGVYVTQWGSSGNEDSQFAQWDGPSGIAVDSSGNVYVADYGNNRIEKFTSTGAYLVNWGSAGGGTGQFNNPNGIAADSYGNVYVDDTGNNRVGEFTSSGAYEGTWNSYGNPKATFNVPFGIATSSNGNLYIADAHNNVMVKYLLHIPPVPAVTGLSPAQGPVSGGTAVTITGTGFTGATAVWFGTNTSTNYTVNADTRITAVSPANPSGTVNVTVTTPGGTSALSAGDKFTYGVVPVIPTVTGISPVSGPTAGGTAVNITGTGFTGATNVTFGTTPAPSFTVNSATSIKATSPAHAVGLVNITVTTPGGTSLISTADRYTFTLSPVTPTVTGISPTYGTTAGGTEVIVTGTTFTGATSVKFGSAAGTIIVNTGSLIVVSSPANAAGTVDVTVTTPTGTSTTSPADRFTNVGTPTVTGISPTGGPVSGGTAVIINGTGFIGVTAVMFGTTPAFAIPGTQSNNPNQVAAGTQIIISAPTHTAGIVNITVTTPFGTSPISAADKYTYK